MKVITKNMVKTVFHIHQNFQLHNSLNEAIAKSNYHCVSFTDFENVLEELDETVEMIVISIEQLSSSMMNFFKIIRKSEFARIPLVALVSTRNGQNLKNIMKLGFNDYLSLENSYDEIATQISEYLKPVTTNFVSVDNLKIAIIDDDILHTRLMENLFRNKGFNNLDSFISAEQFLKSPVESDLYLVDIVMEKISGIKLIKKIRQSYPNSTIFVVTSVADSRIILTAMENGADDYIIKPIDNDVFTAKVIARYKKF